MDIIINIFNENYWLGEIIIILLLTWISRKLLSQSIKKLHRKFLKTQTAWDDCIIKAIKNPIFFLTISLGLTFCAEILYHEFETHMLSYASDVRSLVIIISIAWFFNNFVKTYQDFYLRNKLPHRKKIDRATVDTVTTITLIFIYVVTGLSVLQLLGFNISGILALGGAGGIAIGFAAKDLLSNFFGGLMIYFDRPFQVGDWIRSSDKEIEGDVIKIGWRQTQVLTFDKRPIYIPNSVFSTIVVQNPSRMTHRRIRETFGVRYEDVSKLEKITKEVKEYLIKHKEIDENQTLIVNVNEFSNSSIDFFVYTFTHTTNWVKYHEVKQEILLAIAKIIEKNGAEIAFPTSTIHLDQEIERKTKTIQKKTPAKKATKKTSKNTNKK